MRDSICVRPCIYHSNRDERPLIGSQMSVERERPKWIWCLVGNVVKERPYGPNHEVRRGTKRFAPGTKVYCYPVKWGDGYERIYVLGKPREKY